MAMCRLLQLQLLLLLLVEMSLGVGQTALGISKKLL